jgi:flagellar basal body P-ring protein FlgI
MNQRVWLFGALVCGLLGCAHQQTRLQAEDEGERDKEAEVKTIGDVSSVANAEPIPVNGIGLVIGLDGTGGGATPGPYRQRLEDQLRKSQVEDIKKLLASPETSLVLVQALIPAGARKGDPLDVEITLPRESKTKSLRGGRLWECTLYNYDTKKNRDGGDTYLQGHPVAKAEGSLVVGLGDGDAQARLRQGRIWGGGRCQIDRPFYVVLNDSEQKVRMAKMVADRINETFHGSVHGQAADLAEAKNKAVVYLGVPPQYRLNLPRYLRVVRLIPLWGTEAARIPYQRRLEEQLSDPARTVTAALRLEALGQDSIPTLKRGLTSERPLVRFCAAEALAYLGDPGCGEELARTIKEQPLLRAFSLTAMASLDEAICHVELARLLAEPSTETRYGAFRALRVLDETAEPVHGELLNDCFWLHRVAPGSPPLVHIASRGRAEIVLFGEDPCLIPPFPILAGEFTITANKEDEKCTVTRISLRHGKSKLQCGLKLNDVLRTLAAMGGEYADAVEFLRRVDQLQCLNCPVAVDALPQATSVYDVAKAGAGDAEFLKTNPEILNARADFSSTPTLFEKNTGSHSPSAIAQDEEAVRHDRKNNSDKSTSDHKGRTADNAVE